MSLPNLASESKTRLGRTTARILGIETSCDETAAAIVEDGRLILSSVVASQAELHTQFGGVFPEVASRQHIRTIYAVVEKCLQEAHMHLTDINAVAVTQGPGLPGSLVIGVNFAKGLALSSNLPLLGINHLEAHLYSAWLHWPSLSEEPQGRERLQPEPQFPLVALIVSGGHTELVLIEAHLKYHRLGGTLDDAAGEAFDKIARLIGLGYPGGPAIQKAAESGNPYAFDFPRAWLEDSYDFSFSGLKTAVLREVRQLQKYRSVLPVSDLAASFQAAVVEVLVKKTLRASEEMEAKGILVVGGVSANRALRAGILSESPIPVHIPPIALCTDNAAMIASAGYYRFMQGYRSPSDFDVLPNWSLDELEQPQR